jgi:hypothetical protein
MAKSSTFYKQGKHNETVALLLNYFPTIAHNSEDRAVIAYMISQAAKKKRLSRRKWLIISAISDLQLAKKGIYFVAFVGFLMYENGDIDRATNT